MRRENWAYGYEDHDTAIGQEYCYFVKAYYEDIGESPATNTSCQAWELYPPSDIVAEDGDGYVDLTWDLPVGGEEVSLSSNRTCRIPFCDSLKDALCSGLRLL